MLFVHPSKMSSSLSFTDLKASNDGKHLSFEVNGVNVAVVNALRRCIVSHVPTVAFDYNPACHPQQLPQCGILIRANTSPIHNEMLGHRLSLVPICLDEKQMAAFVEDPMMYTFALRVQNDSPDVKLVTTKDINVYDKSGTPVPSSVRDGLFPACKVTGDHVILTKLNPGLQQDDGGKVELECVASVGTEYKHSRWCPVSVCYFVNKIDPEAAELALRDRGIQPGSPEAAQFYTLDALRYYHKNEYGEANAFEFRLESECGLRASFLVHQGLTVALERVRGIRRAIEERNTSKVAIASTAEIAQASDNPTEKARSTARSQEQDTGGLYNIIVSHEDHTSGNLIQAMIYEKNFRRVEKEKSEITYIGYHQPHPLEHCIVFRLVMRNKSASAEAFMVANLIWVEQVLEGYISEWKAAAAKV